MGILLGLFGFLLAYENEIPIVSHLIYKRVNALESGFNKVCGFPIRIENVSERYRKIIEGDFNLGPQDEGFEELSDFIKKDLNRNKSEYFAKTWSGTMSFNEFRRRALKDGFSKMSYQGIPGNETGIEAPIGNNRINAYLKNSSTEYASFFVYKIQKGIEKEHKSKTFAYASFIYFLGLFIQIFQFDWCDEAKKLRHTT